MNHSLWRDNKTQKQYQEYASRSPKNKPCEFCTFTVDNDQIVRDAGRFWIAKNTFPYTIWDSFYIDDHLMLIPKQHVDSIAKLSSEELNDFGRLLAEYEAMGYSTYGRAASNGAKSIAHQHTHLLRVSKRRVTKLIYLRRFGLTWFR